MPIFNPSGSSSADDPLEPVIRVQTDDQTIPDNQSVVVVGPYTIEAGNTLTFGGTESRMQILEGAPSTFGFGSYLSSLTSLGTPTMFGSAVSMTPMRTGRVLVVCTASAKRSGPGTTLMSLMAQIRYGTGTAPSPGDLETGTQVGPSVLAQSDVVTAAAVLYMPLTITGVVSGLGIGIPYWFDIAKFFANGVSNLANASLLVQEY